MRQVMVSLSIEDFEKDIANSFPPEDEEVITTHKHVISESILEALRPGSRGFNREFQLYVSDWGFKLGDLDSRVPITIWHGENDRNVPIEVQ